MKMLHIGIASYKEMKTRTIAIAKGKIKPSSKEPKVWFTSAESFARVLSDKNRALLDVIAENAPQSITELAVLTGRKKSNLSRTLKTMAHYGLVALRKTDSGTLAPHVPYSNISLVMPVGHLA